VHNKATNMLGASDDAIHSQYNYFIVNIIISSSQCKSAAGGPSRLGKILIQATDDLCDTRSNFMPTVQGLFNVSQPVRYFELICVHQKPSFHVIISYHPWPRQPRSGADQLRQLVPAVCH
jgi:hypothetical protein